MYISFYNDLNCRFSTKIGQLKESGLIDHWIEVEQDKVGRLTNTETGTTEAAPLSVSNLQVSQGFCKSEHDLILTVIFSRLRVLSICGACLF